MGITVSAVHGVNPSLGLCFFCMEAKEVVLLGAMSPQRRERLFGPGHEDYSDTPNSAAAPRQAVYNREPCAKCAEYMKQGIILISADPDKSEDNNPWRTGGWCVVKEEFVQRLKSLMQAELVDRSLECRFAFIEDQVWDSLKLPRGATTEKETT